MVNRRPYRGGLRNGVVAMLGTKGLTQETTEQRKTYPGMAYFAGTGPVGMTCEKCQFYGYARETRRGDRMRTVSGCRKFWDLTGHPGPSFTRDAVACKYFASITEKP